MALSRTTVHSQNSGAPAFGTGGFTTSSFTPPDSSLLVVAATAMEDGGTTDPSGDMTISGGGLTWTSRAVIGKAPSFSQGLRIWTAPVSTGASMTITLDCGTRSIYRYVVSIVAYTGYDTGSPIGATATNGNPTVDGQVILTLSTAPADGSEVLGALATDTAVSSTPGSGWTEIHDLQNLGDAGLQTQVRAATPLGAPTFFGKGTLNAENAGTSITPIAFPAGIQANDIAVLAVGCNGSSTFTTPTGQGSWAVLGTSLESDAGQSTEWYWLRLTGSEASESVTASATFSNTVGGYGQIFVFRGCTTSGNPFEGVGNAGTVSETTPDTSACTTTGADRLVACIAALDNDTDYASGIPPSGWTRDATGSSSTVGGDWRTDLIYRTEASATTVSSAVVGTLGASTRWRTLTFALIPQGGNDPAVTWADTDTGGTIVDDVVAAIEIKVSTGTSGSVAETQDNQTSTAAGWIEITGTVAETQDAQTSTASGVLGYTGTSARTQANQTSTASGTVTGTEVTGSVAETQDNQTATASGVLGYSGTSARTQANQTSTASGVLGYTGTVARTQANQTSTATGVLGYSGTSARTQANQTSTASGTVGGAGEVSGGVAETQDPQTSTATGQLGSSGTGARTQANQTATATGWITITGTVAETQDSQTAAATGHLGATGTVARTQANQTATAAGWITVTGLVTETQDNQTAAGVGFFGEIPIPSGHPLVVSPSNVRVRYGRNQVTVDSDTHVVEVR